MACKFYIDGVEVKESAFLRSIKKDIADLDLSKVFTDEMTAKPEVKTIKPEVKVEEKVAEEKPVGITKEAMKPERVEANLSDEDKLYIKQNRQKQWEDVKEEIAKDPTLPQTTISELITEKREPNSKDMLVLLHEKVRLQVESEDVYKELGEANKEDNELARANLLIRMEAVEDNERQLLQVIDLVGSKAGSLLQSLKSLADKRFNYSTIANKIEKEQGKPLSKEQETKFRKVAEDYKVLKQQMSDLQEKIAKDKEEREAKEAESRKLFEEKLIAKIKAEFKSRRPSFESKAKVAADRLRGLKTKPFVFKDSTGNIIEVHTMGITWNDLIEAGAKAIEISGKIADGVAAALSKIKNTDWYKKFSEQDKIAFEKQLEQHFKDISKKPLTFDDITQNAIEKANGEFHEGLKYDVDKMVRSLVENDLNITHTEVTDKIYDVLKEHMPLTKEDVRDMISGYGKFKTLSKEQVDVAVREIRTQNRLDAALQAVKEKNELPLRTGAERHEKSQAAREKEREILKVIKEKGLTPELSEEDIENQYKSAEASYQTRLENAIADIEKEIETGIKKERVAGKTKEYTSERTKQLQADLERLKEIRDAKFNPPKTEAEIAQAKKEARENVKIKATEKAIEQITNEINNLKYGGQVPENIGVITREGEKFFAPKRKASNKITNDRIQELEGIKKGLEIERSKLLPDEIKNEAIILKAREARQKRLDKLQQQIDAKDFAPKPKPEPLPFDEQTREINLKIKKLENIVAEERMKIKRENAGNFLKVASWLSMIQRFGIFFSYRATGKLALAALYRPVFEPVYGLSRYMLSNIPVAKDIMRKSTTQYTTNLSDLGKQMNDYYIGLTSKATFKGALSEFNKHSDWQLKHEDKPSVRFYNNMVARILELPQQSHGFMKAFPKYAKYESFYNQALRTLATEINPQTGKNFDITNPEVQHEAMKMAERDALADIFMNSSEGAKMITGLIEKLQTSESSVSQALGLYLQQSMPVIKVAQNFGGEIIDMIPVIGTLKAIEKIYPIAGGKEISKGIKNLTTERAQKVSRILTRQLVGGIFTAAGIALYNSYGDDALDELEHSHYWLHNSAYPLVMSGMFMAKQYKESGGEKSDAASAAIVSYGKTIKKVVVDLPQSSATIDIGRILTSKDNSALSKKIKQMAARLLTVQALSDWAKTLDEEKKRDPETFAEMVKMGIPVLRETVPEEGEREEEE